MLDPRPEDVCIEDIAHALSLLCRYAGHCTTFYSVAEHSLLVESKMKTDDARMRLGALLHDAAEAYLVDIPRPLKGHIPPYGQIELNVEVAIAEKFDLYWPIKQASIGALDNRILLDERAQIMTPTNHDWNIEGKPLSVKVRGYHPQQAESLFLRRFNELWGALNP
nr:phosphohydrolase [Mycoplana azooxidifex]